MDEKNQNNESQNIQNQNKYDISKSNFFANIDSDKKNEQTQQIQNSGTINTPISSINPQNIPNIQNNFYQNPNQNTIPQYTFYPQKNDTMAKSNFYPSSSYQLNNPYQNQQFNYPNNQNYYPQGQPQPIGESQSFLQKVGSSAMNLI